MPAKQKKSYVPRLKTLFKDSVSQELMKRFKYSTPMQIPRIEKIVVSMGIGEAVSNKKLLDAAVKDLSIITGQRPIKTKARKSIANFKVREGQEIGVKVTLRNNYMWEFLDRFINVAMPRIKDFRGIKAKSFDGRGSYSMGISEQIIFPEIDYDKIEKVSGMNIAIITTAKNDEEAFSLLKELGMPFRSK